MSAPLTKKDSNTSATYSVASTSASVKSFLKLKFKKSEKSPKFINTDPSIRTTVDYLSYKS